MATFFYCHCRPFYLSLRAPFYLSLRAEGVAISGKAKLKNQNAKWKKQSVISSQQSAVSSQ